MLPYSMEMAFNSAQADTGVPFETTSFQFKPLLPNILSTPSQGIYFYFFELTGTLHI